MPLIESERRVSRPIARPNWRVTSGVTCETLCSVSRSDTPRGPVGRVPLGAGTLHRVTTLLQATKRRKTAFDTSKYGELVNGQRVLGPLQLPVAAVGAGLAVFGSRALVRLPPPATGGLFGPAIALLTLSLVVWAGLFLLPLGLLIPPTGRYGIEFDDNQRRLLMSTTITVAIGPFAGVGMAFVTPWIVPQTLTLSTCVALLPLGATLLWRAGQALRSHAA